MQNTTSCGAKDHSALEKIILHATVRNFKMDFQTVPCTFIFFNAEWSLAPQHMVFCMQLTVAGKHIVNAEWSLAPQDVVLCISTSPSSSSSSSSTSPSSSSS